MGSGHACPYSVRSSHRTHFHQSFKCRYSRLFVYFELPLTHSHSDANTLLTTSQLFALLHLIAPKPRPAFASEKTYITSSPSGLPAGPLPLPCWYDRWLAERLLSEQKTQPDDAFSVPDVETIEPAELYISVVVPAYNEEERILPNLEEAVAYLDERVGRPTVAEKSRDMHQKKPSGYEIIVVSDGSTDKTVEVVLKFAQENGLHDVLRVVSLTKNRGKGGAVTHGLRHVRGEYALFADADGASRFSDLGKLIEGCEKMVKGSNRGVAIASRAHLVGSEAVVKVYYPHPYLAEAVFNLLTSTPALSFA